MSHVIGALPPHGEQLFLILWGCFTFLLFVLSFGINLALVILFLLLTCTFLLLAGGVAVGTGPKIHANSAKVCLDSILHNLFPLCKPLQLATQSACQAWAVS